ncbi:hypothetical protein JCM10449v2_004622 [Rhodotorula kratochvilovae]
MPATLPPELVSACLQALDPADPETVPTLLAASLVSTSFRSLAQASLLWRPIADARFHQHRPPSKQLDAPPFATEACRYFAWRARKDLRARSLVREFQRPRGRLPLAHELRQLGSDVVESRGAAPEAFTEQTRPESWLSLRHWAGECRRLLLRDEAIEVWRGIAERDALGQEADDDFERGLNAFAAFRGLDPARLARERFDLERNHPRLLEETRSLPFEGQRRLEWLAREVVEYLESVGLRKAPNGAFHNLDNHYVELVWRRATSPNPDDNEGTLPMTLVSMFCSLVNRLPAARELKIRAKPVGFPGTLLAGLAYEGSNEWTYVNVFGEGRLLTADKLREMLRAMGQPESPEFLQPATAREMCLRVARNILTSIRAGDQSIGVPIGHETATASLYSVSHALFLLTEPLGADPAVPVTRGTEQFAEWVRSLVQAEFPLDVSHLETRIAPLLSPLMRYSMLELCAAIKDEDASPPEPKLVNGDIKWRIGHVFQHRLFGYEAVVRGWDYKCEASEQWIRQMRVDTLPYGRAQPFYHVVVRDGSARYVAQENITDMPVADGVVEQVMEVDGFGRYFRKRERRESDGRWQFVPSQEVEAEYPDS